MKKRKGITLVELLASIGMIAIILPCLMIIMSSASKDSITDDNKLTVSNINQTAIETLRGKGKNFLKTMLNSDKYEGYFYFNNEENFEDKLEDNLKNKTFINGNLDDMNNNKGSNLYGLYLNMNLSNNMGTKTSGGNNVTVSEGMKVLRIEVKTCIFNDSPKNYNSLALYISR